MQLLHRSYSINLLDVSITACQSITLGAAGFAGGYYLVQTLFTTTITRIALGAIGATLLGGAPAVQYIAHIFCLYKGYYTVPQPIPPVSVDEALLKASSDLTAAENTFHTALSLKNEAIKAYMAILKQVEKRELSQDALKSPQEKVDKATADYEQAYSAWEKAKEALLKAAPDLAAAKDTLGTALAANNGANSKYMCIFRQVLEGALKQDALIGPQKEVDETTAKYLEAHSAQQRAKEACDNGIAGILACPSLISAYVQARSKAFYLQSAIFELYYIAICTTFVALGILNIPQTLILLSTLSLHPFFLALSTYRRSEPNNDNLAFWAARDEEIYEEVFS